MPVQDHYKIDLWQLRPGQIVEIHRAENKALLASGTADVDGQFSHTYLASLGAAYAVTRDVPGALPWSALEDVEPGEYRLLPTYGGYLMKCVIGGTTGASAPTNDYPHRQWGQSHDVAVAAFQATQVFNRQRLWTYGYATLVSGTTWPDGAPSSWPWERVVEIAGSHEGRYALLDDGTVRFTHYQEYTASTTVGRGNAWAKIQALNASTKIVKMWAIYSGVFLLDVDRQLHWVWDGAGSTVAASQTTVDDWLTANPGPYRCALPGVNGIGRASVVLDDGTLVTRGTGAAPSIAASYASGGSFTDIGAVVLNSNLTLLAVTEQGTRLRGWSTLSPGAAVDTTLPMGDTVARLEAAYQVTAAQTRLGQRLTCLNVASTAMTNVTRPYLQNSRPEEMQVHSPGWMSSGTAENVLVVTPTSVHPAVGVFAGGPKYTPTIIGNSGHYNMPTPGALTTHEPFMLHANPIILDGDAVWQLVPAPAAIPVPALLSTVSQEAPLLQDGTVSGTVLVAGAAAARQVVALQADPAGQPRQIIGETTSDPDDGSYSLVLEGFTDPVIVVALDAAGSPWSASTGIALDARVFPSADGHTGLVYQAMVAGTTGGSEPTWPTVLGATVVDGSVTWQAIEYYRPLAHGPVHPDVT